MAPQPEAASRQEFELLADSDDPPSQDLIAQEIVEDPDAAMVQFHLIAGALGEIPAIVGAD
jgi:hypothetical protein